MKKKQTKTQKTKEAKIARKSPNSTLTKEPVKKKLSSSIAPQKKKESRVLPVQEHQSSRDTRSYSCFNKISQWLKKLFDA